VNLPATTVLGYPRIRRDRELKRATEAYRRGQFMAITLLTVAAAIRRHRSVAFSGSR
jgi:hypothetical protein